MKKKKYFIIIILLLAISIMSVGYATFTTNLEIKGTATIIGKWDVRITNIEIVSSSPGIEAETPTFSNTNIEFYTELIKPGDEVKYQITISNQGNINAQLDDILFMSDETDENSAISFETSEVSQNLNAGEETTFFITIKYKENITKVPDVQTKKITGIIVYVQC